MIAPPIEIVEVSPRDGLQNEKTAVCTADKVELVMRAVAAGARRVEAVSFVNPKTVPQMADAEAVMEILRDTHELRSKGVTISGLALNRRGLDRALAAEVDEVNFVVIASETFNRRNQGASIAGTMSELERATALCQSENLPFSLTIGAAFGCPFEGEVPLGRVVEIATQAAALGAKEIALADTIGVADPLTVECRIAAVQSVAHEMPIRCHFHDTRGTGVANAYAAWRAGAATLDTSLGGIGGCPFAPAATGNIATEDTVYMFNRMGINTGFDLQALIASSLWLAERLGKALPAAMGRAGDFPGPGHLERLRA
jgi:hydroxymethylglutaryl-CoA lyase